jgi:hypothetical protein
MENRETITTLEEGVCYPGGTYVTFDGLLTRDHTYIGFITKDSDKIYYTRVDAKANLRTGEGIDGPIMYKPTGAEIAHLHDCYKRHKSELLDSSVCFPTSVDAHEIF